MIRTFDVSFLNSVANHPDVRPWLGGEGEIDLAPVMGQPCNFAFRSANGGFVCHKQEPGIYEAHSLFLPEGRGREAVGLMRKAFRYLFASTDCVEVRTKVPANNLPARGLARLAGFRPLFERQGVWDGHAVSYETLTVDEWMGRDRELLGLGHWFHEQLEAAKTAQGSALETHPDDPAHDRAVGASVLMCRAGNPAKAVQTYNRWASLAGYQSIALLSEHPVVLDVRDAVVEVVGDQMEVLLCR